MTPVVSVRDLRMSYGGTDVLTGVDFDIGAGEVVTLLGPNGAGKTTTIEILEGFRIRSAGEVTVLGQDPAKADEDWRARTGVVLQSWRDHPGGRRDNSSSSSAATSRRTPLPNASVRMTSTCCSRPWD
jgi:ABC-type multidrug transport system ATPase subunit